MTDRKKAEVIHIKILRGMHDLSMVDEVAANIKGAEVVLMEYVASEPQKDAWRRWAHDITCNPAYADAYGSTLPEEYKNVFNLIVWQYRKSQVLFVPVDITIDDPLQKAAEEMLMPFDMETDLDQLISTRDFAAFYKIVDANTHKNSLVIQKRDRLVAKQVAQFIEEDQASPEPHTKFVIVQGYNHHVKPYIETALSGMRVSITEDLYNAAITQIMSMPVNALTYDKLVHPKLPVDHRAVDRLLVSAFTSVLDMPELDFAIDLASQNFMDADSTQKIIQVDQKTQNMSADEIHATLNKILDILAQQSLEKA